MQSTSSVSAARALVHLPCRIGRVLAAILGEVVKALLRFSLFAGGGLLMLACAIGLLVCLFQTYVHPSPHFPLAIYLPASLACGVIGWVLRSLAD